MTREKFMKKLVAEIKNRYVGYHVNVNFPRGRVSDGGNRIILQTELEHGTKVQDIFNRAKDVRVSIGLPQLIPFEEGNTISIAVLLSDFRKNSLVEILQSDLFLNGDMGIPLAIGYNARGDMCIVDLAELPHLLIGGAPHMGKSVSLYCIVFSIIARQSLNDVQIVIINTGSDDLKEFAGHSSLYLPVASDEASGLRTIFALDSERKRRLELTEGERKSLPFLVCVFDEFNTFIKEIGKHYDGGVVKTFKDTIEGLLYKGRHAKIHLVLATQNCMVKNLGIDFGAITARMAFTCGNSQESKSLLDEGGAEDLPGNGAMLLKISDGKRPQHIQGAFISPEDRKIVFAGDAFQAMISDDNKFTQEVRLDTASNGEAGLEDEMDLCVPRSAPDNAAIAKRKELARVIMWTLGQTEISSNKIQKAFNISRRADTLMDQLFQLGLVTEKYGKQPRKVIPQSVEDLTPEVMALLAEHRVTADDIAEVFAQRTAPCSEGETSV